MSMVDLCTTSLNHLGTGEKWLRFVDDHLDLIRINSDKTWLTRTELSRYEYRPEDYLILHQIPLGILPVFFRVNYLKTSRDFYQLEYVYIPKLNYLQELYDEYLSVEARELKG